MIAVNVKMLVISSNERKKSTKAIEAPTFSKPSIARNSLSDVKSIKLKRHLYSHYDENHSDLARFYGT